MLSSSSLIVPHRAVNSPWSVGPLAYLRSSAQGHAHAHVRSTAAYHKMHISMHPAQQVLSAVIIILSSPTRVAWCCHVVLGTTKQIRNSQDKTRPIGGEGGRDVEWVVEPSPGSPGRGRALNHGCIGKGKRKTCVWLLATGRKAKANSNNNRAAPSLVTSQLQPQPHTHTSSVAKRVWQPRNPDRKTRSKLLIASNLSLKGRAAMLFFFPGASSLLRLLLHLVGLPIAD